MPDSPDRGTAEKRYDQLRVDRDPFLRRARECAKYTIPSLIPDQGHTGSDDFVTPYQSLGTRGVNHLAGKLLLGLLPASVAFFRLMPDPRAVNTAKPPLSPQAITAMQAALAKIERTLLQTIESRGLRVHAFEAFKHLIVGGNVLIGITRNSTRVWPLHQYVVNRDPEGSILEIIVKECVSPDVLPDEVRQEILNRTEPAPTGEPAKSVDIFTYVRRQKSRFVSYQECKGMVIPGSSGSWPVEKVPYLALRWSRIDGESYGRGHCEEYLGDLVSFEGLSRAIVEAAASASKVLWMVKPGSTTRPDDLAEAENNAFVPGDLEDVGCLQQQKSSDLTMTANTAQAIESRLSYAFLLNSAVQRDAERVTAEEIRYVADELETALGGVYSIFSQEFQRPLVMVLLAQAMRDRDIPTFPPKAVNPIIVTGVDALGRSQQYSRLNNVLLQASEILTPQAVVPRINVAAFLQVAFDAEGIQNEGIIKSDAQYQQELQQQQQMAMMQAATPNAVKAVGDNVNQQQQQAAQQETSQ